MINLAWRGSVHHWGTLLITALVPLLVRIDAPDLRLLKDGDYPGIVLMVVALGTLQYVLEEGARWNWLDDRTIRSIVQLISAVQKTNAEVMKGKNAEAWAGFSRQLAARVGQLINTGSVRELQDGRDMLEEIASALERVQ